MTVDARDALISLSTTVNGSAVRADVPARLTLADFLRDHLRLTGTHVGCEHGVCGACAVLVDGRSVRACLLFAVQMEGREVTTIEGLTGYETTRRLAAEMTRHHGLQCGFCTAGMLVTATELLDDRDPTHEPLTEEAVRETLSGNVCRCTGYQGIVRAVLAADQEPTTRSCMTSRRDQR